MGKRAGAGSVTVTGLDDLLKTLTDTAPREAGNFARVVVQDVARSIAKEVKAAAPDGYGDLKSSIKYRRAKSKIKHRYLSIVLLNAYRTSKNINIYYWKFHEFGSRFKPNPKPFVLPIKLRFGSQMPDIMRESFGRKLEQRLARKAKKLQKQS